MTNIAIFASGSGSNAENIILFFKEKKTSLTFYIFCNNPNAGVLDRAKKLSVPSFVFTKNDLQTGCVLSDLKKLSVDFIVLAGFLWQFPKDIITQFPNQIVNIHPALLPKYGGKGMYGRHVHEAVVQNKEHESGITIHYVNENYDEGAIIFQKSVTLTDNDNPDDVAQKIHELEYTHFPSVIEKLLLPLL